jgi:hypothetical protein
MWQERQSYDEGRYVKNLQRYGLKTYADLQPAGPLVLNFFWDGCGLLLTMKFALPRFASLTLWLLPAVVLAAPIPDAPFWQDVAVRIHHAPELTNAIFKKLCVDKENIACPWRSVNLWRNIVAYSFRAETNRYLTIATPGRSSMATGSPFCINSSPFISSFSLRSSRVI